MWELPVHAGPWISLWYLALITRASRNKAFYLCSSRSVIHIASSWRSKCRWKDNAIEKRKQTTKEECEKILFHFIFPLGENIKKNEANIKTRILKTPGKQKVWTKLVLEKHKQSRQEEDWKGQKRTEKHRKKQRHFSVAAYKASGVYCFAKVGDGTKTKSSGSERSPYTRTLSLSPSPRARCLSESLGKLNGQKPPTTPDLVDHDNYPNPKQDHRNTVGSFRHRRRKMNQHRLSR